MIAIILAVLAGALGIGLTYGVARARHRWEPLTVRLASAGVVLIAAAAIALPDAYRVPVAGAYIAAALLGSLAWPSILNRGSAVASEETPHE